MDHIKGSFTVLPFLVAMLVAVAGMPTNVVQVNFGQMGIEHTQPWRSTATTAIGRVGRTLLSRLRDMCTGWHGQPLALPAMAAAALLAVAWLEPTEHVALWANVVVFGAAKQLASLRQEAQTLRTRTLELNQKIVDKTPLTEAERTELETLRTRSLEVAAALTTAEEANEAERTEAARVAAAASGTTDPDARASEAARIAAGLPAVVPGQDRTELEAKQPGFFGRQLLAVKAFAANGGWMHITAEEKRILQIPIGGGQRNTVQAAATGLNTDIGSEGGFLVGQDRSNTILQRSYSQGEILSRVSRMPISPNSNGIKLPAIDETSRADNSRFGGIASGWLGQGNTLATGKPKFREMDMKLKKVGAFVYATDEQITDAIALEAWINKYLPLELTFRTEDAFVNGTGAGQPLGAKNSGAVISISRNTSNRILSEDLRGMWKRLWAPSRKNAVWLIDQSCEDEFDLLAIAIGTGGVPDPSYKPAGSQPGQVFATYKGRPILTVEYCAALGTVGDVVLWAPDEYTAIDRGPVEQAVSMHVAFLTDEQAFRFIYRVDGQLNWNAVLTPKSGGPTLSPVVTLAT